jgi:asparagine synthase (glutamine-hydrolysing)
MPGIVGIFTSRPREWAEPLLSHMIEAIRHEEFYQTGTRIDERLGLYTGWVARKGSFADRMPICSERTGVSMVFSGEEFSEKTAVQSLRERGYAVPSNGPGYLVHLYDEDPAFLRTLNGRFHGVISDPNRKVGILFNDRYGMHRIYYHESKDAFYFAAEAKAILAVCPELRVADPRGLGEFLSCGCVLENRTLFQCLNVLPPAAEWIFTSGKVECRSTYFNPREWEEQEALGLEDYYEMLRDVFSRTLPRYFTGRQRIGMSVTGGLDTRLILAWHKPSRGSLPCYSFGGMFRESQDVTLGRQMAEACGHQHQVIPVGRDFLFRFPHYAERAVYLTDGCVDVSHSPDLYVNEIAREIAPVRMTGNYGGEVLRRVRAFKPVKFPSGLFTDDIARHLDGATAVYSRLIQGHPLSFAVFRQAPWHHYGLLALEQTQLSLRSPFLDNEFVQTVFRAPASASLNDNICLQLIADGDPALADVRTDMGLVRKPNLMSAAARELLTFTFKAEYGYDCGMPQWVARIDHLFAGLHLERLFLGRHKFYHFRVWYRDFLSSYVKEILLDPRTLSRPYLQRRSLETVVQQHVKGDHNHTTSIHKVLTLELIHRVLLETR